MCEWTIEVYEPRNEINRHLFYVRAQQEFIYECYKRLTVCVQSSLSQVSLLDKLVKASVSNVIALTQPHGRAYLEGCMPQLWRCIMYVFVCMWIYTAYNDVDIFVGTCAQRTRFRLCLTHNRNVHSLSNEIPSRPFILACMRKREKTM